MSSDDTHKGGSGSSGETDSSLEITRKTDFARRLSDAAVSGKSSTAQHSNSPNNIVHVNFGASLRRSPRRSTLARNSIPRRPANPSSLYPESLDQVSPWVLRIIAMVGIVLLSLLVL